MYIKYGEHLPELVIMKIWQLNMHQDFVISLAGTTNPSETPELTPNL